MSNLLLTIAAWVALIYYQESYSPELDFEYLRSNWLWVKEDFFNGLNGKFF